MDLQKEISAVANHIEYISDVKDPIYKMVAINRCRRCTKNVEFCFKMKHQPEEFWANSFEHCLEIKKKYNAGCACRDRFLLLGYNSLLKGTFLLEDLQRLHHSFPQALMFERTLESLNIQLKEPELVVKKKLLVLHENFIQFCIAQFTEFISCHYCLHAYDPHSSNYVKEFFSYIGGNKNKCVSHAVKFSKELNVSLPCLYCRNPIKLVMVHHPVFFKMFTFTGLGSGSGSESEFDYCIKMQKMGLFCQFFLKRYIQHVDFFEKFFKYFLSSYPYITWLEWIVIQFHLGNIEFFKKESDLVGSLEFKILYCTYLEIDLDKLLRLEPLTIHDLFINFGCVKFLASYLA